MPLSWNEIKTRAAAFVNGWKDTAPYTGEEAEAQTFENEFFNIFGIDRKKVAVFEKKVKLNDGSQAGDSATGYIDLFWKGHILIEMKSPGKDLDKAYQQAKNYALALKDKDFPKAILICDFINFHYYDLTEDGKLYQFKLTELVQHIELFSGLAGYKEIGIYNHWDPVNREAAEKMGRLHDRLKEIGYTGHQLELYLVRLLFCLFADDTGIFEPPNHFNRYIVERTAEDGSDLALHIQKIFEVLNKPKDKRLKTIDEQLNQFPYINGSLFEETIETADFDRPMRDTLIECCTLDWSKISPAIFGAMFQSVKDKEKRRALGEHYTSEENILKLIHPLFLDGLKEEFKNIKKMALSKRKEKLAEFHNKLASLKFLDPACGCGNFLVISYRELRLLELEVIELLLGKEKVLDVQNEIKVNVNQFYGIEIEEFPAQIAQTAMWLMDHLMNMQVRERFGQYYVRIPLTSAASIHNKNALTTDWESVVPKNELSYILGNPPFLGKKYQSLEQKAAGHQVLAELSGGKSLDFVACWYILAAKCMAENSNIQTAFVSTNSITQGEQVSLLWQPLFNQYGIVINFAHQTFKWSNEARGKAAVYCVIIGFSRQDKPNKRLYRYAEITGSASETTVKHINGYLIDGPDLWITNRTRPVSPIPEMTAGNKPVDYNHLKIEAEDYPAFIKRDPHSKQYIKRMIGADEFINNRERYCLWLNNCPPDELRKMPEVLKRVNACKKARLQSVDPGARKLAETPTVFRETMNPASYLVIPAVSSERRKYIPMGFYGKKTIPVMGVLIIPKATCYHFGVLTSAMHMVWIRYVCGRLKSDYRYSKDIGYNNFPWPSPTDKQKGAVESAAQAVLDTRAEFPKSSLADLYDPAAMPPELVKAHRRLDKAVEKAYGKTFDDDSQRAAYLFELYQSLTGELFKEQKKRGKGKK